MIGGMSWYSTLDYYRLINKYVEEKLGGYHSAKIVMACADFELVTNSLSKRDYNSLAQIVLKEAKKLESAGADFYIICSNTTHIVADKLAGEVKIPILHIADALGEEMKLAGIKKIALIGTKYLMESDIYSKGLAKYGIEVVAPNPADIETVNQIIFDELVLGKTTEESHQKYIKIINSLIKAGAEGVLLGCTEIHLLIKQKDLPVPIFDSTHIHAIAAAKMAVV